jgi:hypothetical protein
MRGRERGARPAAFSPEGLGGALTHHTGGTEVWGTLPRLGNHREDLLTVRLSQSMRHTHLGGCARERRHLEPRSERTHMPWTHLPISGRSEALPR